LCANRDTPANKNTQPQRITRSSGLGDETYAPPSLTNVPMSLDMGACRAEFEAVAFGAVKDILNKASVSPRQVGIVITNSSLFNTTPSLSAMIMNHFKMGSNTINYNLGGMGCSAGVIAVDLARQMLQLQPDTYALVVSTENITQNWYFGNDRAMLIPNCLFRVGGAAMLLSNRHAKYELAHVVRTHIGASDPAYQCVYQREDGARQVGVHLSKDLMAIAGHALKANITALGPLVLPLSEKLKFALNLAARKLLKAKSIAPCAVARHALPVRQHVVVVGVVHPGPHRVDDGRGARRARVADCVWVRV